MSFTHVRYVDASGSIISNVAGDQINIDHSITIHQCCRCTNPAMASRQLSQLPFNHERDLQSWSTSATHVSPGLQNHTCSNNEEARVTATRITAEILSLLTNLPEALYHCKDLKLELLSVQKALDLVGLAIQAYDHTPLWTGLANMIDPECRRCCVVLQEMLDKIKTLRQDLPTQSSYEYMGRFDSSLPELDELAPSRMRLSRCLISFTAVLVALNSVYWVEIGNAFRTGLVSLEAFYSILQIGPRSLRHIEVDKIRVVDHLGRNIPVPLIFCSSWKDFDYVINGYCKGEIGNRYIQQGEYNLIRGQDLKSINTLEFSSAVAAEMTFEISIIVRLKTSRNKECPRCWYINPSVKADSQWIKCHNCSLYFQVSEEDREHIKKNTRIQGDNGFFMDVDFPAVFDNHEDVNTHYEDLDLPATDHMAGVSEQTFSPPISKSAIRPQNEREKFRRISVVNTKIMPAELWLQIPSHSGSFIEEEPWLAAPHPDSRSIITTERIRAASMPRRKNLPICPCDECGDTFTTNFARDRHMKTHSGEMRLH